MRMLTTDLVARTPVFASLADHERTELLQVLTHENYKPGADVIASGDMGRGLHVIAEGSAEVIIHEQGGGDRVVATLGLGAVFGEVSLLHGWDSTATVRATSDLEVLTLPGDAFEAMLDKQNLIAYKISVNIARILAERLREADKLLAEHPSSTAKPTD